MQLACCRDHLGKLWTRWHAMAPHACRGLFSSSPIAVCTPAHSSQSQPSPELLLPGTEQRPGSTSLIAVASPLCINPLAHPRDSRCFVSTVGGGASGRRTGNHRGPLLLRGAPPSSACCRGEGVDGWSLWRPRSLPPACCRRNALCHPAANPLPLAPAGMGTLAAATCGGLGAAAARQQPGCSTSGRQLAAAALLAPAERRQARLLVSSPAVRTVPVLKPHHTNLLHSIGSTPCGLIHMACCACLLCLPAAAAPGGAPPPPARRGAFCCAGSAACSRRLSSQGRGLCGAAAPHQMRAAARRNPVGLWLPTEFKGPVRCSLVLWCGWRAGRG